MLVRVRQMPKTWNPRVRQRAVLLWTKGYTREQIRAELAKAKLDVPVTTIRKWTDGIPRSGGEPWDFEKAPLDEVRIGRLMYLHALDAGVAEPWPSAAQVRWFVRTRLSVPKEWPISWCYDMARYAAAVSEQEQRDIARSLMLWSADPAMLVPESLLARERLEATVGGTAWATLPVGETEPTAAMGSPTP